MKITVLHSEIPTNAPIDEQETLLQVEEVKNGLQQLGYTVKTLAFTWDIPLFIEELKYQKPDVVFNLVESIEGKSHFIHVVPMLLKNLNFPFTGCTGSSILLSTNKIYAKKILQYKNFPTPTWFDEDEIKQGFLIPETPFIIKSTTEHGSFGIDQSSIINNNASLKTKLNANKIKWGGDWYVEKYIAGREINISVLECKEQLRVLPPAEISFTHFPECFYPIVDYKAKWDVQSKNFQGSEVRFDFSIKDKKLLQYLSQLTKAVAKSFNVSGYARIDFRIDEHSQPWILEINVNPSISKTAGFTLASFKAGMNYTDILQNLVETALKKSS